MSMGAVLPKPGAPLTTQLGLRMLQNEHAEEFGSPDCSGPVLVDEEVGEGKGKPTRVGGKL